MAYLTGECLCGKIRYEYRGKTGNLVHCHCSRCRKWHGAAFRSRMVVKQDGYKLIQGQEYLAQYQSTPNVIKTFCKNCGSSLATVYPLRDNLLGLPIAGCQGQLDNYSEFHIYTDSKAQWWQISDRFLMQSLYAKRYPFGTTEETSATRCIAHLNIKPCQKIRPLFTALMNR